MTEKLYFLTEPVHPFPDRSRKVDRRSDAFINSDAPRAGDEVVGVRDNFFFGRPRDAVPGIEAKEYALLGSKSGPGMALHNPGNIFGKTL